MVPAVAFAADDVTEPVKVDAYNQDVSETVGDVTIAENGSMSVVANASDGYSASVTTGNITAPNGSGAVAQAEGSGTSASVTINGDVEVGGMGIGAASGGGATADVTVNGNVTSSGAVSSLEIASGIQAMAFENGATTVTINGDVKAPGAGAYLISASDSTVNLVVDGDLTSDMVGLALAYESEKAAIDALVTGTIDGKTLGVDLNGAFEGDVPKTVVLTVWKIILNETGIAAGTVRDISPSDDTGYQPQITQNENFEKTIKYIVKVEQPTAGGTVTVTDAEGNALDKSHGYEIAYEGDKVLLKVNVEDGYKLMAAYNGDGEKVALVQDADGNYYYEVPKGGGVYLSVELEKVNGDEPAEEEEPISAPEEEQASPTKVASEGSGLPKTADSAPGLLVLMTITLAGAGLALSGVATTRKRQQKAGKHVR
ncbi:MAG: hypothetical protein ACOYIP_08690 [Coriobacteriales bacterium]